MAGPSAAQFTPYASGRAVTVSPARPQPIQTSGATLPSSGQALPAGQVFLALPATGARAPAAPVRPSDGPTVQRTYFQPTADRPSSAPEDGTYQIQVDPPGLERISRVENDRALQERIRQESRRVDPKESVPFPEEPTLSKGTYGGRGNLWNVRQLTVEPCFVCHKRLLFEELNAERYGWDFGVLQPVVSTAYFYKDVALLPYHLATDVCRCHECNTGKCLPGDPVPYLLYPPELSLTGTVAEAGVILALVAIFP